MPELPEDVRSVLHKGDSQITGAGEDRIYTETEGDDTEDHLKDLILLESTEQIEAE